MPHMPHIHRELLFSKHIQELTQIDGLNSSYSIVFNVINRNYGHRY